MEQPSSLYLRKNFTFGIITIFIIFFLQNIYLFLQTGTFNSITISNNDTSQTVQMMLIMSIIKLLTVTLSGFFLTLHLPLYQFRNAIMLGSIIGLIWGIIGLMQIILFMANTPPQLVDTSAQSLLNVLTFIPKEMIISSFTTFIGAIFAYSRPIIISDNGSSVNEE